MKVSLCKNVFYSGVYEGKKRPCWECLTLSSEMRLRKSFLFVCVLHAANIRWVLRRLSSPRQLRMILQVCLGKRSCVGPVRSFFLPYSVWSVLRCLPCSNLGLNIKPVQSMSCWFLTWFFQYVLLLFKMFCKFLALALALLPELKDYPPSPNSHTLAIILFYLEARTMDVFCIDSYISPPHSWSLHIAEALWLPFSRFMPNIE